MYSQRLCSMPKTCTGSSQLGCSTGRGSGHEVTPLTKKFFVIDYLWQRGSQFSTMEHHWLCQQHSKAGPCPGLTNCFVANTKQTPCYFVNFCFTCFALLLHIFVLMSFAYFDFHFHGCFVVFYFLFLWESNNIGGEDLGRVQRGIKATKIHCMIKT